MLDFPAEANLERELTAPLLQRILVTVIIAGLALSAVSTTEDFRKTLCLVLGNTVVAAAMLSVARRGFLRTASVVEVLALLLTTVYAMYNGEALYDVSLLIVPGIFVVSSLLLSPRWVLAIIVLTLSAVFCVGMAQLHGLTGAMGKKEHFTAHYIFEVDLLLGALATFFFTTKEHGTGMGLAAVRGTMAEHHGSIDVQSELGHGTRLRIRLPLCEEPARTEPQPPATLLTQTHGRILVADDEAIVANICKMALERGGFQVEVCSSGRTAVERCRTDQFDLILVDLMMPDIDGVEVLRQIRTFDRTAKIMLMTGSASESVETRLKEWPEVVVLSKPMMPNEILEAAMKMLS